MRTTRVIGVLGALVLATGLGAVPSAEARGLSAECRSNPYLPRARDQYDRLEFDPAARTLQRAVEHARNCREDLAEIYRLKGFIDAINAERERCQRAFEILLALDADYRLPADVPPKIRACFEDALSVPSERRSLAVRHETPSSVAPNAPLAVQVQVQDPLRLVDQVQVWFRRAGVQVYTTVSARADDQISVVIPALSLPGTPEGYELEYFVRAVDRWEGALYESGSASVPMSFRVEKDDRSSPVVESWWFWTAIGVVALGAAATAYAVSQNDGGTISLSIADGGSR